MIEQNKDNLFFYLLFLRITPLLPNWLINLAGPIVGIPLKTFIFATLFGLMPANIIHIQMGSQLSEIDRIGFDFKVKIYLIIL